MLEVRLSCGARSYGGTFFVLDSHQACQVLMQVKQQIVLSATEAAEMILRVDDIIKVSAAHLRSYLYNLPVY